GCGGWWDEPSCPFRAQRGHNNIVLSDPCEGEDRKGTRWTTRSQTWNPRVMSRASWDRAEAGTRPTRPAPAPPNPWQGRARHWRPVTGADAERGRGGTTLAAPTVLLGRALGGSARQR